MTQFTPTKSSTASSIAMAKKNATAIRWYILLLPIEHRGNPKGLSEEQAIAKSKGIPFDFFAPKLVEVVQEDGQLVRTERPLLFNYVFVRASEEYIYQRKQENLRNYNFMPRVTTAQGTHYPFVEDDVMQQFQWVAKAYGGVIPCYLPGQEKLVKGDRVKLTKGPLKGTTATVVYHNEGKNSTLMVCIDDWMWVPLLKIRPGDYELVSLRQADNRIYSRLDNERLQERIHQAVGRQKAGKLTQEDIQLATETLRMLEQMKVDTDVMRCKLNALLLQVYTLLGNKDECERIIGESRLFYPLIKAEQAKALLATVLYGITDSSIYHEECHRITAAWKKEDKPKKFKTTLLQHIEDYDTWLNHK